MRDVAEESLAVLRLRLGPLAGAHELPDHERDRHVHEGAQDVVHLDLEVVEGRDEDEVGQETGQDAGEHARCGSVAGRERDRDEEPGELDVAQAELVADGGEARRDEREEKGDPVGPHAPGPETRPACHPSEDGAAELRPPPHGSLPSDAS